jgi:hypothetical protein
MTTKKSAAQLREIYGILHGKSRIFSKNTIPLFLSLTPERRALAGVPVSSACVIKRTVYFS